MRDYQTAPQPPTAPSRRYPCFLRAEASAADRGYQQMALHGFVCVVWLRTTISGVLAGPPALTPAPLDAYPRIKPGYTLTPAANLM